MSLIQKLTRRTFLVLSLAGLAAGLGSFAEAAPIAGKDYQILKQAQPTNSADKVEVLEFFSYGCPHCKDLEPLLEGWMKKAPKDVVVRRVPVFSEPLQRMYLSLEALGETDRLNNQIFSAIHDQNVRMQDEKVQMNWVAAHGVDLKKYQAMYNSFSINSGVKRNQQLAQDYHIEGIPSLAVAGRYVTSAAMTGNHAASLLVLDDLIAKARSGRK